MDKFNKRVIQLEYNVRMNFDAILLCTYMISFIVKLFK